MRSSRLSRPTASIPVDSREAGFEKPETLITVFQEPEDVKTVEGFILMETEELKKLYQSLNLAMTFQDFSPYPELF